MGKRGPARVPVEILEARGSQLVSRRKKAAEGVVKLDVGSGQGKKVVMRCPAWLDRRGKDIWKEMVAKLERMRVLAESDRHALAQLCNGLSKIERLERELRKTGESVVTAQGQLQRHPLVGVLGQVEAHTYRLMCQFGLTPSTRSNVRAVMSEDPAPKEGKIHYFRQ